MNSGGNRRIANWKESVYNDEAVRGMKELGESIGEKGINFLSCCPKITSRVLDRMLRPAPFAKFFYNWPNGTIDEEHEQCPYIQEQKKCKLARTIEYRGFKEVQVNRV